jgi:hypothetical protein
MKSKAKEKGRVVKTISHVCNLPEMYSKRLVDVPLGTGDTTSVHGGELAEEVAGQIDGAVVAAHALVNDGTGGGLAVVGDGHGLAAVTVLHDTNGQGKDVLGGAVVGGAAGAGVGGSGGGIVESDHAVARGALGAGASVTAASSGLSVGGAGVGGSGRAGGGGGGGGGRGSGSSLCLNGGSGSGLGSASAGGRHSLLLLGSLRGSDNGGSSGGRDSSDGHGNNGGGGNLVGVESGGDIDGGPDDVGNGLPNNSALGDWSGIAGHGEESASEGECLGDRGHCD